MSTVLASVSSACATIVLDRPYTYACDPNNGIAAALAGILYIWVLVFPLCIFSTVLIYIVFILL